MNLSTNGATTNSDSISWNAPEVVNSTNSVPQPDPGLAFGTQTWQADYTIWDDYCDGEIEHYVSSVNSNEEGTLTFVRPLGLSVGQPLIFTLEGLTYATVGGSTVDLSQVRFKLNGDWHDPVAVTNNAAGGWDVSYLLVVGTDLLGTNTIKQGNFTWPSSSSNYTESGCVDNPCPYGPPYQWTETFTTHHLSFIGFHNQLPTCGPDVTELVTNILAQVQAKWDSVWTNTFQRCAACASLHDVVDFVNNDSQWPGNTEAGIAWDIFALKKIGFGEYNGFNNPPYRGEANTIYTNTVSFRGKCYFASAVNYALWGKMNRLCSSFYLYPPYSNPFTLPKAEAATYLWKIIQYHSFGNTAILEAMSFTAIGYSGWNWLPSFSMPASLRSDPDNKNKISERPDDAWRWDPNWNGHPIGSTVQSWCSCHLPPY